MEVRERWRKRERVKSKRESLRFDRAAGGSGGDDDGCCCCLAPLPYSTHFKTNSTLSKLPKHSLPTPVQADAVPLILGGGDVLAAAETGSGKTGAFALPLLQAVAEARAGVAGGSSALPRVAHAGGRSEEEGGEGRDGETPSSAVRVSATDRDSLLAVSACGLRAQARSEKKWAGARATAGVSLSSAAGAEQGQLVFFEATVRDEGLARVGWSSSSASLDLGADAAGVGFGGSGKLVRSGKFIDFGVAGGGGGFGKGDVVGCALDPRERRAFFFKNGEPVVLRDAAASAADADAAAAAAAAAAVDLPEGMVESDSVLFPAFALKNAEVELNFGGDLEKKPFAFLPPPPSGGGRTFVALAASPLLLARREKEEETATPTSETIAKKNQKLLPLALVLEPLKDLAEQTAGVFESLARYLPAPGVSTLLLVGGAGGGASARQEAQEARAALRAGAADVVVGTLGRVASAVEDGSLDLSGVRFFVLDEADRLVDALNADALFSLAARLPKTPRDLGGEGGGSAAAAARLQTLFFSATLHSPRVEAAAARLCPRALRVDLKGAGFVPDSVDHLCVRPDPRADASWLQARPRVPTDGVHRGSAAASLLASDSSSAAAVALVSGNSGGDGTGEEEDDDRRNELLSLALKRLKARLLVRVVDSLRMPRAVVFCRANHDCVQLARFLSSLKEEGGAAQDEALAAAFKEEEEEGEGEGDGEKGGGGKRHKKGHNVSSSSPSSSPFLFPSGPYSCAVLGGARTTDERREALRLFRDGRVRFLVATDAAARGIDAAGLPYCVNFSLPSPASSEDYVHRVGRVGRAGAAGLAVSLVAAEGVREKVWFVSKKGYKPWEVKRGPALANDRRLASEGGHTVWIDESESLRAVCERLRGPVQELGEGLELPEGVKARVEATAARAGGGGAGGDGGGGGNGPPALAGYGSVVGDEGMTAAAKVIRERLDQLAPAVKKLAGLEEDAQTSFFELQTRWGG